MPVATENEFLDSIKSRFIEECRSINGEVKVGREGSEEIIKCILPKKIDAFIKFEDESTRGRYSLAIDDIKTDPPQNLLYIPIEKTDSEDTGNIYVHINKPYETTIEVLNFKKPSYTLTRTHLVKDEVGEVTLRISRLFKSLTVII